jgi:hypothetical protein
LGIGIFDAQDEDAAVSAGVQTAKEGGSGPSYVEKAGWRRGETGAQSHDRASCQVVEVGKR